jgi:hypothetical protein
MDSSTRNRLDGIPVKDLPSMIDGWKGKIQAVESVLIENRGDPSRAKSNAIFEDALRFLREEMEYMRQRFAREYIQSRSQTTHMP